MSDHWKDLADKLGTPSIDPVSRKSSSKWSSGEPLPQTPTTDSKSVTTPSETPPPPSKRSSWDSLSRLFGFGDATPAPPPKQREVEPLPPVEEVRTNDLEIDWKRPEPKSHKGDGKNPQPSSTHPNVKDGNRDVAREPSAREASSKEESRSGKRPRRSAPSMWSEGEPTTETTDVSPEVEPVVESRRREPSRRSEGPRHRGRRPEGDAGRGFSDARSENRGSEPRSVDNRVPDTRSSEVRTSDVRGTDQGQASGEDDVEGVVERRGRRRRPRRGRREGSEAREPVSSVSPRMDDFEEVESAQDEIGWDAPVVHSEEVEVKEVAEEKTGRRRRRRGRGDRSTRAAEFDSVSNEDPDVDPVLNEVDESDEDAPPRHIKIPTWADAISVLVELNAENHRRVAENQGGRRRGPSGGDGFRGDSRGNGPRRGGRGR